MRLTTNVEGEIREFIDPTDFVQDFELVAARDVEELLAEVRQFEPAEVKVRHALAAVCVGEERRGGNRLS